MEFRSAVSPTCSNLFFRFSFLLALVDLQNTPSPALNNADFPQAVSSGHVVRLRESRVVEDSSPEVVHGTSLGHHNLGTGGRATPRMNNHRGRHTTTIVDQRLNCLVGGSVLLQRQRWDGRHENRNILA